jgi:ribonuclease Z
MFRGLTFLGTSSGVPTKHRNVSSSALVLQSGAVWLFDCGEGTQHQLQKCEGVSQGRIERIFITHLHGDHCYGLPGLICSIGMLWRPTESAGGVAEEATGDEVSLLPLNASHNCLEIVGPPSLALMLRTIFRCSDAHFPFRYRVTEIGTDAVSCDRLHDSEAPPLAIPFTNGIVELGAVDGIRIRAAALTHRVLSFGYVLEEAASPGTLDVSKCDALNVPKGPLLAQLKAGNTITLPNGSTVSAAQVVGPPIRGRKLVMLGDTCDSSGIVDAANSADWVVHEATYDDNGADLAVPRGHSTSRMAGAFAATVCARNLLLTHFSARHLPRSKDPTVMETMEAQASEAAPGVVVRAVEDFESVDLQRRR